MLISGLHQTAPGDIDSVAVAHYDADGRLVGRVHHLDGEFLEPVELQSGEMLYGMMPGGRLIPLAQA